MDYFIKSQDEQALWQALEQVGLAEKSYDPEDPLNKRPEDLDMAEGWEPSGAFTWIAKCQLDIIGAIYKPTGETETVDGIEMPVMQALDGYHANLRGDLTDEQKQALPLISAPTTPYRVWA